MNASVATPSASWTHPAEIPFVGREPSSPAVADERRRLDSAAFAAEVERVAGHLAVHGVAAGDVVATMLPNRIEAVSVLFAAWRLGAALTPLNPWLTPEEACFQLADSAARVVVVDDETAPKVATSAATLQPVDGLADDAAPAPAAAADPDATALLIYTSGTTGRPKGVILDHANVAAMLRMNEALVEQRPDDRTIVVLPLFHVNGLIVSVCGALAAGSSTFIVERFSPKTFFGHVERERPALLSLVPAVYLVLLAAAADQEPDLSSLRYCFCGAAPIAPSAMQRFEDTFGVRILEGYGLSECTVSCAVNPPHGRSKPGSVGPAIPGCEIRVVDDEGRPLPVGEVGEVCVKGPNVMRGYLGRPEETAKALRDGWLHTGDVGRLDEDGYLFLVDRTKDMIIRGGENIYPKEIETVLADHPGVFEAAVVGRPDEILGELPVAFVQPADGAAVDADGLDAWCRERLARYKVPVEFRVVDQLPRIAIGKVSKPRLREQLAAG